MKQIGIGDMLVLNGNESNVMYLAKMDNIHNVDGVQCVFLVDDVKNIKNERAYRRYSQQYLNNCGYCLKVGMNSRNLEVVMQDCMSELDAIGVKYGRIISIKVNTRAKRRWGQCKVKDGGFEININAVLLDERNGIVGLKETIHHELIHTVDGCFNHGAEWKKIVDKVNRHYGYNIKRTNSIEDKHLDDSVAEEYNNNKRRKKKINYTVRCTGCGYEWHYQRAGKVVQYADMYTCSCGSKLMNV